MKHHWRPVALCLALFMLSGALFPLGVLSVFAGTTTTIRNDRVTTIYVSEVYDEAVGQLYNETNQGADPYFERVRTGDWFTVKVKVEKTGDYHFCFSFGWLDATGTYHVQVDGGETITLRNTVSGTGWRSWKDTSDMPIHLTEGEHTIKVTMGCDGPNIRALKIAPKGMDFVVKDGGGEAPLYDDSQGVSAVAITNTMAVQFHMTVPFDSINISSASWNNDLGSLRFTLYRWNETYAGTLRGQALESKEFINFKDNTILNFRFDHVQKAGEYMLYIENISDIPQEEVGVWVRDGITTRSRTFIDDVAAGVTPMADIHYTETASNPYGALTPISAAADQIEASASDLYTFGDLTEYRMDSTSLYGVQFKTEAAFEGVEVYVSSAPLTGNQLTLSLYKWVANYATTVKSAPVATTTLSDIATGTWARLSHKAEAGEYLLVISNGTDGMTLYVSETKTEKVNHYLHTSLAGVSLAARVVGKLKLSEPSTPAAQNYITDDAFTWVGTDGLGRVLPTETEAGGVREGKYVGIFFHTWHESLAKARTPVNVTKLVAQYPEAIRDYNHKAWEGSDICFWNEPIWGYYSTADRWVLRKQAELLADAGVDVVFFDSTNATENHMSAMLTLCEVWAEARADGVRTPQISAMLNMYDYKDTATQLIELYDEFYSKGLYQDLWFMWEGKPLMMGYPNELHGMGRDDVLDFFSYRPTNPSYTTDQELILKTENAPATLFNPPTGFRRYTQWKWISVYPQQVMKNVKTGEVEQMCVCVAQNWSAAKGLTAMNAGDMVFGRGYTNKYGVNTSDEAVMAGLNIAEQWEYALEVDPTFIYITGWNEWVASRYEEMWGDLNAIPDNALDGYSRDIEPSTGMLKDHFYHQMVSYIRRFKGVPTQAPSSGAVSDPAHIDWSAVTPVFRAYEGNTLGRDADGYRGYHYKNTTGRNDFVESRVTYDADNLYFMVKTAEAITPYTDQAWMRLFIDVVGAEDEKNWETFEYILNRQSPTADLATLERSTGGWNWETVTTVAYTVDGDTMVVTIPRSALGIGDGSFTVNFKWSDNMQVDGDIMDFYTNGDVAPGARYKYSFTSVVDQAGNGETESDTISETPAPDESATAPETPAPDESNTAPATPAKPGGCSSAVGFLTFPLILSTAWFLRRKE